MNVVRYIIMYYVSYNIHASYKNVKVLNFSGP